ncbi:MAG: AAA family ATPase, partial [Proteobacteria bacterium]|nr:AAA family ATPase [Pseudomonadota bacterium]
MKDDKWTYPGSKWQKFDFHTHTPASDDYGHGDESLKKIHTEEWLRKAMESGLDCVVVADHNVGGWIDKLKAKNREIQNKDVKPGWYRDLTIFPGVEITVADSSSRVHLLAVFDPSCDSQKVTGVLGSCGITTGYGDDTKTSTSTGFVATVKKIIEAGGIAIPAHIDGSKGLLEGITSLTPELGKSLDSIFAAEFCELHRYDQTESSLKKRVDQLAKLAGSDAHTPGEIGRYFSWLKMSRPSIDGLRLALMDYEFCVKNQDENPNQLPDIFLSTLTIKSMLHCGRIPGKPFTICMHPHFNCLVGGRGTGKSTVLESIRIVSRRDQELAFEAPRVKEELDRFMTLSQNKGVMLSDTEILLEIHRRGKKFQLRWRFDGQGSILEAEENKTWKEVEAGDLKERFPISIYSQKQINELSSNPRGLLEVVDRSPEVDRAEWKSRWEGVKSQFLQLREQHRELLRQLSSEQQIRAKLQDVENDLKLYEEKGHGEILKLYQKLSQQKNSLPKNQVFDDLSAGIRDLVANTGLSDFPSHLFDEKDDTTPEMKSIHEQTVQGLNKVSASLEALAQSVDALKNQRIKKIESSKWFQLLQSSIKAYNGLVKEYEEKKSRLSISLYGEWVQQRNQLQQHLNKLDSVRKETGGIEKQIETTLQKLFDLRKDLIEKRRKFLNNVIGQSAFVRMELVQFGEGSLLEAEYRTLLNLDDGKFTSSVCDTDVKKGIL